jgi:hypothetical protein
METIRKKKWIMRTLMIVVTLAMVATIILPYVIQ